MKGSIINVMFIIIFIFLVSCHENESINTSPLDSNTPVTITKQNEDDFTDFTDNPILTKADNGSSYGPYFGRVLYDDGIYKMWFANSFGGDRYNIGYAESVDGLNWNIVQNPVLEPGLPGSWDSHSVHPGAIIKKGKIFRMYYGGQSAPNNPSLRRIGLAISLDGKNWVKKSEKILDKIDLYGYTTDIVKVKGTYYLYYGNNVEVGVSTSSDGINWTKKNPIVVSASEPWEGSRIWSCTVIYERKKFKMLYNNGSRDAFGYAESFDGINWIKKLTPIFTYTETYNQWPFDIRYPFLRKINNKYFLFYSTVSNNYECKIGVATGTSL